MFAQIKHLAIISDNYTLLSRFYQALFGMKSSESPRPESAVAIGDGYIGMNIIPQKLGRQAGLEHFGLEVEDVEKVGARLREKYPSVQLVKRPTNRPFAGISTHDPDGYVFDLSQQQMTNRAEVYVEGEWKQDRYISHFTLRSLNPANLAKFYREVYELQETEKPNDDPNHYLTDGRVTIVVAPWAITDYEGAGIEPRHMDHLGFRVEDRGCLQKRSAGFDQKKSCVSAKTRRNGRRNQIEFARQVQARAVSALRSGRCAHRCFRGALSSIVYSSKAGCEPEGSHPVHMDHWSSKVDEIFSTTNATNRDDPSGRCGHLDDLPQFPAVLPNLAPVAGKLASAGTVMPVTQSILAGPG